jgi:phenylalanyl-tRNA synthetase beta chain
MRLLVSWLRDFVDVTAPPEEIAAKLGLRGFEVAGIDPLGDGDAVIDLEITANRPDCMSVVGLAREVATVYDLPLTLPSATPGARIPMAGAPIGTSDRLTIALEDEVLCPRYAAAVADVTIGPSPPWMTARLQAAGVRPISSIVDVTNYVLLELGHPMHAFDLATLAGGELHIRRAKPGEAITTLDGIARTLDADMLVIADAVRAQAIAGVMGGAGSEVSSATKTVVFESAYFKPSSVRRASKRLGLTTEASSRFERGADVNAPVSALQRALALMALVGAGRVVDPLLDAYPQPQSARRLRLRRSRLALLLGTTVPDADVERILSGLGLAVTASADGWDVVVPTFRVDLLREVDLIEEVGRHHGFERLKPTFPAQPSAAPPADPRIARDALVRRVLTGAGLSEAVTFGFIETGTAEAFGGGDGTLVALENPLSAKFAVLRPSLLPGLLDALAHNRRHGRRDVRLFEIGARFRIGVGETRGVGLAWTGTAVPEHWSSGAREVDFFDVKGVAEQLCRVLAVRIRLKTTRERYLVDGQAASIDAGEARVGVAGRLTPAAAEGRGLPRQDAVFVLELDLDGLWAVGVAATRAEQDDAGTPPSDAVCPLPRHPFVVRDLSIVVADTLPAEIIRGTIQTAGASTTTPLVGVAFFDRYQGKGVPDGAVSLSVRLTFQAPDRTLTDADVQQRFETILAALVLEHGAVQR